MGEPLRVFLVGERPEDVAALRSRLAGSGSVIVIGEALAADLQSGTTRLPAGTDAVLMSPGAVRRPRLTPVSAEEPPIEPLTPRERSVLGLAAEGLGNREIARELDISEHTVKFHLASIFGKLGASSRTEAVRRGLRLGVIEI